MDEETRQFVIDAEHLKLLRWGYFLSAGITACFSLFGLLYAGMALLFTSLPVEEGQEAPPEQIAWIFGIVGIGITVVMLAVAAAKLKVAKALRERTSRTFCFVVAVITMFGMPYGTLLGVFTLLVLSRPSVAQAFGANASAPLPQPGEPRSGVPPHTC